MAVANQKLCLCLTNPFKLKTTHRELALILSKRLGFFPAGQFLIAQPPSGAVGWRTYVYAGPIDQWLERLQEDEEAPTVKLPRADPIDGLHESVYRTFLKALNFYVEDQDISSILHIGSLNVNPCELEGKTWRTTKYSEGWAYLYKPTILERSDIELDNLHESTEAQLVNSPCICTSQSSSSSSVVFNMMKRQLWHNPLSSAIKTHTDLERLMGTLGFVAGPYLAPPPSNGAVPWRSYIFRGNTRWMEKLNHEEEPPIVKLPHPIMDGLHEFTYTSFLKAVNFYLEKDDISSIFEVKSVHVNVGELEESSSWKASEQIVGGRQYIYRPTTLDMDKICVYNTKAILSWVHQNGA